MISTEKIRFDSAIFMMAFVSALMLLVVPSPVRGQVGEEKEQVAAADERPSARDQQPAPVIENLEGVTIGMTAEEVEKKLGDPETRDAASMYFDLGKDRSLQLRLDKDKKVAVIAAVYSGSDSNPPALADVFGPAVKAEPAENGTVYRLVRYPSAGYWVAYSKLNAGEGLTTVTINKIDH